MLELKNISFSAENDNGQKQILKDFEAKTGDKNYKKNKSFFDKVKDLFD